MENFFTMPSPASTGLLMIDMQEKFLSAIGEMPSAAEQCGILIRSMKTLSCPVFVSEQYPAGLGPTLKELKDDLPSDAKFFEKSAFSCMSDEAIKNEIISSWSGIKSLVIAGVEAHVCIFQTAVEAAGMGLNVFVADNACASRKPDEKASALAQLRSSGISVLPVESIVFMLLKDSHHPLFKSISRIVTLRDRQPLPTGERAKLV